MFKAGNNDIVRASSYKTNETIMNSSKKLKNNKSKNLTHVLNIEALKKLTFLIFNIKKTLNYLKQAFIKAPILQHFDLKRYI